jgi:hypothetical protein
MNTVSTGRESIIWVWWVEVEVIFLTASMFFCEEAGKMGELKA